MRGRGTVSRRALLSRAGAAGLVGLAGCNALSTDGPGTTPTRTAPATSTLADTIRFDGGGAEAFADALRTAEATPGSTLEVAAGTYRLDGSTVDHGQPHTHFTADGLRNVTIEGNGAELVVTTPTLGVLGLFNSDHVTIRDLRFDYESPPFTQATIVAVDDAHRTIEVEIEAGMPTFDAPHFTTRELGRERRWATIHDPATGNFLQERSLGATTIGFDDPVAIGDRRYRIQNVQPMRGIATGRRFVAVARLPFKHAVLLANCVEPVFEGVTIHAAPAFAVLATDCEAPTFRDVAIRPRGGSGRAIASNADGIHVLGCAPGPTIEGCHAERLQDDAYVVATSMNPVTEVLDDRTVTVRPLVGTRIRPGDTIQGFDTDFARLGTLPAVESVATNDLQLPGAWGRPVRVTFAASIAETIQAGDLLRNRSRSNQGFAIRDSVSRETRARHVRVTSRDGTIERNDLDGSAFPAIMLAGGRFFWPQSPPEAVTVRDNTIRDAGLNGFTTRFRGAIDAWIHLGDWRDGTRPAGRPIRDLTITGNTVTNSAFKGIQVDDAEGVRIEDNVVEDPNQVGGAQDAYGIGLVNDTDVTLVGNRVRGSSRDLEQFARRAGTGELTVRANALIIDGRSVPPAVVEPSNDG